MSDQFHFTILGCGSSGGVPRIGTGWGACDPANRKNKRLRSGALLERRGANGTTTILFDTSPDLRAQLLSQQIEALDGVFYTHDHADHVHGIDELRPIAQKMGKMIPTFADPTTASILRKRFDYCFKQPSGGSLHQPILTLETLNYGQSVTINGAGGSIDLLGFEQLHGPGRTVGYRIGNMCYATDVSAFPKASMAHIRGLDLLVLGCLRYKAHPSHFSLKQAQNLIEEIAPKRTILTHLHLDFDYETLRSQLPAHIEPAYDGFKVSWNK